MVEIQAILVAVDGSPESNNAVAWAAQEAGRRAVPLRVVHVWQSPRVPTDPIQPIPVSEDDYVEQAARIAADAVTGLAIETVTESGNPSATVVRMSRDAGLVILGGKHRNVVDRLVFGSVTTHVLANAFCPVVIVRSDEREVTREPVARPVVVGVDHDDTSDDALEFAFRYASTCGVELVAVQAWTEQELAYGQDTGPTTIRAIQDVLSAGMRVYQDRYPGVSVVSVADCDTPVTALLDWSEKASLLVVGSRGRGFFKGMVLGSVSASVAHQARCSVAVVRPRRTQDLPDGPSS